MVDAPSFIDRDGPAIEAELIAEWESLSGKPLYPAQVERLLISLIAHREFLVRVGIQYAATQNLVAFAEGDKLDELGKLTETARLQPQTSRCTIRFSRADTTTSMLIAAGTRVQNEAGGVTFSTLTPVTLGVGVSQVEAIAAATAPGTFANGFEIGSIQVMVAPIAGITASNITVSNGGSDLESDARYRDRIQLAPNKFSVAGPVGAYQFWTLTADPSIIDAAVLNPARVQVKVYPLTTTGSPSSEILSKVLAALDTQKTRPLTDLVEVLAPTEVQYAITANITLLSTADAATLTAQLQAAASDYAAARRAKLGVNVVRSQLIAALSLPGVYQVELVAPAADEAIALNAWGNCTAITINLVGVSDG